jgi:hypothetical protein
MLHTTHRLLSSRRRVCLLMTAAAALACLAFAPAARAIISDDTATPSFEITVAVAGAATDTAMGVSADASGAYVAGVLSNAAGNADASLVKVAGGVQRWVRSYDSPRHRDDWAYKVAKRGKAATWRGGRGTPPVRRTSCL